MTRNEIDLRSRRTGQEERHALWGTRSVFSMRGDVLFSVLREFVVEWKYSMFYPPAHTHNHRRLYDFKGRHARLLRALCVSVSLSQ